MSMEDWIKHHRALLELEVAEEASLLSDRITFLSAKACENEGLSIVNLEVLATRTELFGRCCVEFQKIGKAALPTCFKVGDEVTIIPADTRNTTNTSGETGSFQEDCDIFGLIKSTSQFTIEVVIDEYDDRLVDFPLRLNLRPSMKTHSKMMEALVSMAQSPHPLLTLMYRPKEIVFDQKMLVNGNSKIINWYNNGLNESQMNAIETCLNASYVSIVHGPPGTGKTSTLTELLMQALERRQKVLVCAPSNIAVDTILMRLVDCLSDNKRDNKSKSQVTLANFRNQIVRLGHPARVSASILEFTLDSHIEHDEATEIVNDIRKEMQELRSKLQNPRSFKSKTDSTKMNRREIRSELKAIKKEAIVREKAVVERLIRNASIVFATCVGTSSHLLKDLQFDLVVVDEAAQALEAACWIPIMKSSKCVLAGDHCQLPPTIKSKSAEEGGLNMTLFEKIIKDNRFANIVKLLNVQYRMNDVISRWASKNMYNNHVLSATSVMNHTIFDLLPNSNRNDCGEDPENAVMLMIDTSDCYMFEDSSDGTSHRNINEADIVLQHVVYLLQSGIRPSDIGVITPYNGQLELLRDLFMTTANGDPDGTMKAIHSNILPQLAGVDIKTIDGFQGGEKECIIISLVRSNESHTVGFLGENRRINVAVTRAKRQVTIVCDSSTCSTNSFIKTLIDHIEEQGAVIPADVYMDQHAHVQTKVVTETVAKAKEKGKSKENSKKKIFSAISNKTSSSKKFASDQPAVQIANNTNIQNSKSSVSDELCSKIKELLEDYAVDKIGNGIIDKELTRGLRSQEGANSLIFPASLSSFHRLHVHQVAEELGLVHISTGEGIDRRISVSKRVSSPNKQDMSKQKLDTNSKAVVDAPLIESDTEISDQATGAESTSCNKAVSNSTSAATKSKKGSASKKDKKTEEKQLDEDEFLNNLVQQNLKLAELQKYRMGARPMPNYDKELSKQKLKSKLAEAQASRRPTSSSSEKETSSSSSLSSSRNKVVKKPIPNFGGGKLGTK